MYNHSIHHTLQFWWCKTITVNYICIIYYLKYIYFTPKLALCYIRLTMNYICIILSFVKYNYLYPSLVCVFFYRRQKPCLSEALLAERTRHICLWQKNLGRRWNVSHNASPLFLFTHSRSVVSNLIS